MSMTPEQRAAASERMKAMHEAKRSAQSESSVAVKTKPKSKAPPKGVIKRTIAPSKAEILSSDRHKERMVALQEGALQYGMYDPMSGFKKDPNYHYVTADAPNKTDGGYRGSSCSRDHFERLGYELVKDHGISLPSDTQVIMRIPLSQYHQKQLAQEVQVMHQFENAEVHGGDNLGEAHLVENTRKLSEPRAVQGFVRDE